MATRTSQHHIIYIPGLGDTTYPHMQRLMLRTWRIYGVYGHFHLIGWNNAESFDDKLAGILQEIDDLVKAGHIVSLLGASAGASMALHAFAKRKDKLAGVVLVCGELGSAVDIEPSYYEENPAFEPSMRRLPAALETLTGDDRLRIMSIHPLYDETVPIKDTQLEGARMFTSVSFGHAVTIVFTLTIDFYVPYWFLARWARKMR